MLRDVIGGAGLSFYPQVALIIFLLAFLCICVFLFFGKKAAWNQARYMPLEESDRTGSDGMSDDAGKSGEGRADGGE